MTRVYHFRAIVVPQVPWPKVKATGEQSGQRRPDRAVRNFDRTATDLLNVNARQGTKEDYLIGGDGGKKWSRLCEQIFRVDKGSLCRG